MADPVADIVIRLRSLRIARGWTTSEMFRVLRRHVDRKRPRKPSTIRDVARRVERYRKAAALGICVDCEQPKSCPQVRCQTCRDKANAYRRGKYMQESEGVVRRRYRCSGCGGTDGHNRTSPRCPVRAGRASAA